MNRRDALKAAAGTAAALATTAELLMPVKVNSEHRVKRPGSTAAS